MSKIALFIIFLCAEILLVVSCHFERMDVRSAMPPPATLSSNKVIAATLPQATPPPAYLITPMQVLQLDNYTEGVAVDRQDNIYFSQPKAGTITVLAPDGSQRLWTQLPGANGHKLMPDGTHIVAAQKSVVQLDANGKLLKVVAKEFKGKPLVYPNDITIDPQGGFYFTDSGDSNPQNPNGAVYYVAPTGKINRVATGLAYANGLLLTPDRKHLFVDESNRNRVDIYDVRSQGLLGPQKVFALLPVKQGEQIDNKPDGMCLDAMGNLYVAHYGMRQVEVLNPDGQLIRRYASGNLTTSNCAFGGPNLDHLFVTGSLEAGNSKGGLFRLDLGVPGLDIRAYCCHPSAKYFCHCPGLSDTTPWRQ